MSSPNWNLDPKQNLPRSAGIGLVIDVTQELPKNKYGAGVTVVKIAAADKPGQDLRSHFPVGV